jgi:hypothetical protein
MSTVPQLEIWLAAHPQPDTRRVKRGSFLLGSSRRSGIAPLDVTSEPVPSSGALPEARRSETQGDPGYSLGNEGLFLLGSSRRSGIAPLDVKCEPILSSGALPEARRSETQGDPGYSLLEDH